MSAIGKIIIQITHNELCNSNNASELFCSSIDPLGCQIQLLHSNQMYPKKFMLYIFTRGEFSNLYIIGIILNNPFLSRKNRNTNKIYPK
ncbi:MAG TPA: hypothetical protein PKI74_07135, partial [Candidatus Cloacimonas acidaminovorans]|nr:hypothetical protein [Candidatus Cloacimonas acidaminovorans]